jgi:hypothetical protein
MELISIVAATSVYAPSPIALDPFVEDSHLVGLSVRRCARCAVERHAPASTLLDRLACWTAKSSKQVRVVAESPKEILLQADQQILPAAAFA